MKACCFVETLGVLERLRLSAEVEKKALEFRSDTAEGKSLFCAAIFAYNQFDAMIANEIRKAKNAL